MCPGHEIDIVDGDGTVLGPGEIGNIAVKRPDPVLFESYWNDEDGTEARFVDDWYLTGDMGKKDDDYYIYFAGREDDVIITSGYRVGPSEVENALSGHDAVKHAGVIGVPDDTRGKLIKAYIETTTGYSGSEALREELQEVVKDNLAKHEYPREVEFVDEMPIGPNGDVLRRELREIEGIEA
jgi:acetyl-CoA synthetase